MTRYEEMIIYKKQFNDLILNTFGIHHEKEILKSMKIYHEQKMNVTVDENSHIAFYPGAFFERYDHVYKYGEKDRFDLDSLEYMLRLYRWLMHDNSTEFRDGLSFNDIQHDQGYII